MSLYNNNYVPFTSQIEMWSPSTSTNNIHLNKTPAIFSTTPESYSRFYHHEPVYYPTECIICGLSHTKTEHPITTTIITPTPTPLLSTKRNRIIIQSSKKNKSLSYSIRNTIHKFIKICNQLTRFKFPLFSIKNHNIYPVKRKAQFESEKCDVFSK